jgi:hypothetical protein
MIRGVIIASKSEFIFAQTLRPPPPPFFNFEPGQMIKSIATKIPTIIQKDRGRLVT